MTALLSSLTPRSISLLRAARPSHSCPLPGRRGCFLRTRRLLPGAAISAGGVTLLLIAAPWFVSGQITSSVREFGLIGITFVIATCQLILSIVVLDGPTAGATIIHQREEARTP